MNDGFIYDKRTCCVPKMVHRVIREQNYEKASELLGRLFGSAPDVAGQINSCIKANGVAMFFDCLDRYEFSPDILEKLQAVRSVLYGLEENDRWDGKGLAEIEEAEGGQGDGE
ncbi:MAG: hypothetical protein ACYCYM_09745 [Saccharofermentanales bacterium]